MTERLDHKERKVHKEQMVTLALMVHKVLKVYRWRAKLPKQEPLVAHAMVWPKPSRI